MKTVSIRFFFILIFTLLSLYFYIFKIDRIGCVRNGERLKIIENHWWGPALGSLPYKQICILPYSDGGRACESSNECEGDCLVNIEKKASYCEYDNEPKECKFTIETCPSKNSADKDCEFWCEIP